MPVLPIKLAEGIWRAPTLGADLVNSFIFDEPDGTVTLIDAGTRGAPRRLVSALGSIGKKPGDVRRILLTHGHFDHAGGAAKMRHTTGAPVHLHEGDAVYLRDGRRPPIDTTRPLGKVLAHVGSRVPSCDVEATLREGEVLDVGGGLTVLHTPGHSPGHCSFLHRGSGLLITGDALFNFRDRMSYSFALFCSNVPMSRDTADRLGEVDYGTVAFTHGPEIRERARESVREFLLRRRRD